MGFPSKGVPKNRWFIVYAGKSQTKNGWWLGVPPFMETPKMRFVLLFVFIFQGTPAKIRARLGNTWYQYDMAQLNWYQHLWHSSQSRDSFGNPVAIDESCQWKPFSSMVFLLEPSFSSWISKRPSMLAKGIHIRNIGNIEYINWYFISRIVFIIFKWYMTISQKMGVPLKWLVYDVENPIKLDDLGVPMGTTISENHSSTEISDPNDPNDPLPFRRPRVPKSRPAPNAGQSELDSVLEKSCWNVLAYWVHGTG